MSSLQNPSLTMPITFTPVEPLLTSTWKETRRIAKKQAQAAKPHLTFFFMETVTILAPQNFISNHHLFPLHLHQP
jgi:hypothetical protein